MKISAHNLRILFLVFLVFFCFKALAQNELPKEDLKSNRSDLFYDFRGANVVEAAVGTAIINGDLPEPMFEIAFRVGYKRHLYPHLSIGLTYNKFNLAYKELYNEGFMSFDVNLEYLMFPYAPFSPFILVGGGLNASNYFIQNAAKFQGGGGLEFMVSKGLGLRLMADYNYVLSDTLDGKVAGSSDDAFWRILIGAQIYFTGQNAKDRLQRGSPSIMNSNPILKEN